MQQEIDDYIGQRRAEGQAKGTLLGKERILGAVASYLGTRGIINVVDVQPADLDSYMQMLFTSGIKRSTRMSRATTIRAFFRWLKQDYEKAFPEIAVLA